MKLYDLSSQYNDLAEMLENDADNEILQEFLNGLDGAFDGKVESIVKLMRSKAKERDAIDKEIDRLRERANRVNKQTEWLHSYIES